MFLVIFAVSLFFFIVTFCKANIVPVIFMGLTGISFVLVLGFGGVITNNDNLAKEINETHMMFEYGGYKPTENHSLFVKYKLEKYNDYINKAKLSYKEHGEWGPYLKSKIKNN